LATKNAEKPMPCTRRRKPKTTIDDDSAEASAVARTTLVPNARNWRRPTASTQAPTSGWQTMPAAL
jgi:hypothetical protein